MQQLAIFNVTFIHVVRMTDVLLVETIDDQIVGMQILKFSVIAPPTRHPQKFIK